MKLINNKVIQFTNDFDIVGLCDIHIITILLSIKFILATVSIKNPNYDLSRIPQRWLTFKHDKKSHSPFRGQSEKQISDRNWVFL